MRFIKGLLFSALLAPLFQGAPLRAAEFEVLDRFSVDGYTVLRGSADIQSGSFAVGGSTFVVQRGKVGIGTTSPSALLHISSASASAAQDMLKVATGTINADVFVIKGSGNVGIGAQDPAAKLEVAGGSVTIRGSDSNSAIAGFTDAGGNYKVVISTSGNMDVAGGIKVGTFAANCAPELAGTLRWAAGHIAVCNGSDWRQLDNQPPPTISAISPDNGPVSGATAVTITGTGFVPGPELLINGLAATAVTVVSVTQITAVTPASPVGSKIVKLTNPDGQNISATFTYNPLPTLSPVSPDNGRITGGNTITVTGSEFVNGATVKIDNTAASNVTWISASELRAVTPAGASPGLKDVKVTNPDGGFIVLSNGFKYNPLPAFSAVSPNNGVVTGANAITINGSGFIAGATVAIGGADAGGVFVNAGQLTATTPAGPAGPQSVTVTNPDGGSAALGTGFTYNPLPTISGVSPASGPQGTVITITGTGFAADVANVTVGGTAAAILTKTSSQITATTPGSASTGARNVKVTNPDTGAVETTNSFTYTVYATGGDITTSGSYRIHTFTLATSPKTFTVLTAGAADVLVVAGGGGGGNDVGGGGGAGGLVYNSGFAITGSYTVSVGDGGAGATSAAVAPNGANSAFGTITAYGGGGGGSWSGISGASGGSGGGATSNVNGGGGAASPSGQGYPGGASANNTGNVNEYSGASGGGGAGQPGGNGAVSWSAGSSAYGYGGNGLPYSIGGASQYYAGGGGASSDGGSYWSTGGLGGGGRGSSVSATANATANTGGGGGGGGTAGGKGGSGIVIIRYPVDATFYNSAPSLTGVNPASGATRGGYVITLTGSNFAAGAAVTVGGVAANATTVNSGQIVATVKALTSAGAQNIVVTNPGGTAATLTGQFTAQASGESAALAGVTCKGLKTTTGASIGDGAYYINPGGGAFQTYCDMSTDGGGWTLVAYAGDNSAGFPRMDIDVGTFNSLSRSGKASKSAVAIARQSTEMSLAYSPTVNFSGTMAQTTDAVSLVIPNPAIVDLAGSANNGTCTAVTPKRLKPDGSGRIVVGTWATNTSIEAGVWSKSLGGTYNSFAYGFFATLYSCNSWPDTSHHWWVDAQYYNWEPSATINWNGAVNGAASIWFK